MCTHAMMQEGISPGWFMQFSILSSFLIILSIALTVAIICRLLKLPVILGYLFVGILVGPHNLGWLPSTDKIKILADFGVVLLMFTVGLEFSVSKLYMLRRSAFFVGTFQVLFCIVTTTWVALFFKIDLVPATIIGSIVAMSSTAIVMKQLTDQSELNTRYGLHAMGILLFQDLAVIPILVFIVAFTNNAHPLYGQTILWALLKGVIAISVILIAGKLFLGPLFQFIARMKHVEIFTLAVLLVSVGSSWISHELGLSYALGAFIAGMMLAECEHKSQIKSEIRPFRDVLLGLFFISIGMLANVPEWITNWQWILLFLSALMIGKPLVIVILSIFTRYDLSTSVRTGLLLAQGGEFGFAILFLILRDNLIPEVWGQSILAGMLISFLCSPIFIRYNREITQFFLGKQNKIIES